MSKGKKYSVKRLSWLCLGLICVGFAAIGVVLPLMPTTVFLLIAAFAFARSSPRLHLWLLNHKVFGSLIRNWQEHGAITPKAKGVAVLSMGLVLVLSAVLKVPLWVLALQAVILSCVAIFILTRPALSEGAGE